MQVDLKPASDVLAGAMARAASQSTIHPLDTLKVLLHARLNTKRRRAIPDGALHAPPQEPAHGLYGFGLS